MQPFPNKLLSARSVIEANLHMSKICIKRSISLQKMERRRWMANERERRRVRSMRVAYDKLRQVLPYDPSETQLTHMDIVCRAIERIRQLVALLQDGSGDEKSADHTDQTVSVANDEPTALSPTSTSTSLSDILSGSDDIGISLTHRRIKPHRLKINAKLRRRAEETKQAFEALRQRVPFDKSEPYLGHSQVLRRATEYIAFLAELSMMQDLTVI